MKSINPCLSGRQACKSVIHTSYDIATAHGVELKVETLEGVESDFVIKIPTQ